MDYVERRGIVELRLMRDGLALNQSALARELGVSRKTINRDVQAVIRAWRAASAQEVCLEHEQAVAAAYYLTVAKQALKAYARLKAKGDGGAKAVGYLNAGMRAMALRTKLLGVDGFEVAQEPVEQKFVIAYRDARLAGPIPFAGRTEKPDMYRDEDGDLRVVPEEGLPEGAELVTRADLEREALEREAALRAMEREAEQRALEAEEAAAEGGADEGPGLRRYVDWVE